MLRRKKVPTKIESIVQPYGVLDDSGSKSVTLVCNPARIIKHEQLICQYPQDKCVFRVEQGSCLIPLARFTRPGEVKLSLPLGGLVRLLVYILVEIVFELLIKGSGYGICRIFTKKVDPDGAAAIITGIGFWAVIGFIGYALYKGVI